MAELKTMYPGISFSPATKLTAAINASDTVIPVENTAYLPEGPNIATIGTDDDAEVIIYAVKTATSLSGCTRGVEGTAKAWQVGEVIARNWSLTDYQTLMDNIKSLNEHKQEAGDPLATFYPTVTETGDLFWTNDQGLENPKTVNIKGPAGTPGTRGTAILHIKEMPDYRYEYDSHGNVNSYYYKQLETIKSQAGVDEVLVGDALMSELNPGQLYVVTEVSGTLAILKKGSSIMGPKGEDYVLTEADKQKIAEQAAQLVEVPTSGSTIAEDDGNGNITIKSISSLSAIDDGNGNITLR